MEKLVILIFLASLMVNKGFRDAGPPFHPEIFFFYCKRASDGTSSLVTEIYFP